MINNSNIASKNKVFAITNKSHKKNYEKNYEKNDNTSFSNTNLEYNPDESISSNKFKELIIQWSSSSFEKYGSKLKTQSQDLTLQNSFDSSSSPNKLLHNKDTDQYTYQDNIEDTNKNNEDDFNDKKYYSEKITQTVDLFETLDEDNFEEEERMLMETIFMKEERIENIKSLNKKISDSETTMVQKYVPSSEIVTPLRINPIRYEQYLDMKRPTQEHLDEIESEGIRLVNIITSITGSVWAGTKYGRWRNDVKTPFEKMGPILTIFGKQHGTGGIDILEIDKNEKWVKFLNSGVTLIMKEDGIGQC